MKRTLSDRLLRSLARPRATPHEVWDQQLRGFGCRASKQGIVSFFAPDAKIDPKPGGAFQIYIDPDAPAGSRGADESRFMALQPKKMLSFDWNAPPHLPEARAQRTFVVLRFEPVGDRQTRVTLHHTGWGDGGQWDQAYTYFQGAWDGVLGNLRRRFDQGPIDWTEWLAQLKRWREDAAKKSPLK